MSKVRKTFSRAFLLLVMFCMFAVCYCVRFGVVEAAAEVSIMSSDTAWTKAGSPYSLAGPLLVSEGVTLTIEPGATVDLNGYYIRVNGTLRAIGSITDRIQMYSNNDRGGIYFRESSSEWNQKTGSGCIIENANLTNIHISSDVSIKINNNYLKGTIGISGGSSVISYNEIRGTPAAGCISVSGGSAVIAYNWLRATADSWGETGSGISFYESVSNVHIFNNTMTGFDVGIKSSGYLYTSTERNGTVTIERNVISGRFGISIFDEKPSMIIRNNTIEGSRDAVIRNPRSSTTINYNNIKLIVDEYSSSEQYSVYMDRSTDGNEVDATYNWWGTSNEQEISQLILDSSNDFDLGKVNFVPFLTAPNPEAPEVSDLEPLVGPQLEPKTIPQLEPEPEPEQSDWLPLIVAVALIAIPIVAGLGLLVYLSKRK